MSQTKATSMLDGQTVVGIIGAGTMGRGIAEVAAKSGHQVYLWDISSEVLETATAFNNKMRKRAVEKGRITAEEEAAISNRLNYTSSMEELHACGLIIEAIVEKLSIKQELFAKLETIAPNAVFASNTSSLSITELGGSVKQASNFMGLHFFNPAPLMPLVEVVPGLETEPEHINAVVQLMKDWGKLPVQVKDTPGFIVNRVARPFYGEALRLVEEGLASFEEVDTAMRSAGFRMGPFELMDFIGLDINLAVSITVFKQFFNDPRYRPSLLQQQMVRAGRLGRKSGRGFYDYPAGQKFERPEATVSAEKSAAIVNRILAMLINESAEALYLQIASASDLETAVKRGVNYPKGLLAWGDAIGAANVLATLDQLHDRYRDDRYRASVLLRDCAANAATLLNLDLSTQNA